MCLRFNRSPKLLMMYPPVGIQWVLKITSILKHIFCNKISFLTLMPPGFYVTVLKMIGQKLTKSGPIFALNFDHHMNNITLTYRNLILLSDLIL